MLEMGIRSSEKELRWGEASLSHFCLRFGKFSLNPDKAR
ncbi:hypothetical protein HMPREF1051_1053 [Neisseria sicca VK64]|uniref:Uncharacterized protein n=1 Tax=Neisseria sicca VK64 TaxID=1095748 RepID=I2NV31_NEISI|nr:hypothetical protein HMPREF1051_1053 [Neisseria sicca VK64]